MRNQLLINTADSFDGETGYSERFSGTEFKNGDKSNKEFYFRDGTTGAPTFGAVCSKTGETYETHEMPCLIHQL